MIFLPCYKFKQIIRSYDNTAQCLGSFFYLHIYNFEGVAYKLQTFHLRIRCRAGRVSN